MITTKSLKDVQISHDFFQLSEKVGYTTDIIIDYFPEIQELITLWSNAKQVEIYTESHERQWGRLKDTNSVVGSSPFYIDVFHSRILKDENDPLLVVTFHDDILFIRMFTDHDDLFGNFTQKNNPALLKRIKQRISQFLFPKN